MVDPAGSKHDHVLSRRHPIRFLSSMPSVSKILPLALAALLIGSGCASSTPPPEGKNLAAPGSNQQDEDEFEDEGEEEDVEYGEELPAEHDQFEVIQVPTTDQLSEKLRTDLTKIQKCFNEEYKRTKVMCPPVLLEWTHTPSGRVTELRASAERGSSELTSCISALVQRWEFPPHHRGNVPVTYPLKLNCSAS